MTQNKPKRVAQVIAKGDLTGGPGHSVLTLAKELQNTNYSLYVLTHEDGKLIERLAPLTKKTTKVSYSEICKFNPFPWLLTVLSGIIFFLSNKIDIAHFHFHLYRDPLLFAARLCRVKTVLHIRGPAKNFKNTWMDKATAFIFNSNFTKEISKLPKHLEKKAYIVHNAVDLSETTTAQNSLQSELSLKSSTKIVATVSRVHPVKNLEDFIALAAQVKTQDIAFLIIGDIQDEEYKSKLLKLATELKADKNIYFLGHREDINSLYQQLTVLVHTATAEPFGRAIIEAAAHRVPVIAYNSGGVVEIIKHNETGYLAEPNNTEELTKLVVKLLNNKTLADQIVDTADKHIREKFNTQKHAKEIAKIYENL